jgi:hypothetical protein
MERRTLMPHTDAHLQVFSRKGLSDKAMRIAHAHHISSMTFAEKGDILWSRE